MKLPVSSSGSNDPNLITLIQKLQAGQSDPKKPVQPDEDEQPGEKTWSLSRILGMLRRKGIIIGVTSLAFAGFSGLRTAKDIPEFEGSFRLLVEPVVQMPAISDHLTDIKTPPPSDKGLDYTTQIEVLYSPTLLKSALKDVANRYPGSTYNAVVPNLKVARLGETKIIEVSYNDSNPDKVSLILNKLSQAYLEYSRDQRQSQLKQSLKFVEMQLPKIQTRVNELNKALEDLREKYNFIEPSKYAEDLSKQLLTLAQQQQGLQSDMAAAKLRIAGLQEQLGKTSALSQSAKYQAVLQKFQVLEQQIAIESARFGPNSPNIQLLKRQQENLVPILLKEAEAAIAEQLATAEGEHQTLVVRYQTLKKISDRLNQIYGQMPNISRLFDEFKRDLEIATTSLTRFLQTQDSLRTQIAKNDIPWQLLSEPKDLKLKPGASPIKGMISGAITGIFLGITIAALIEKLENTFYVVSDITHKIKLPILGKIPLHPDFQNAYIVDLQLGNKTSSERNLTPTGGKATSLENFMNQVLGSAKPDFDADLMVKAIAEASANDQPIDQLILEDVLVTVERKINQTQNPEDNYWLKEYDAYGFMESFRTLGTNLRLKSLIAGSLVVTSALPGEGRSTVAIHLAQAIAAMGKRVLLVDAHLRKGSQQITAMMNLPKSKGLSDYLMGNAALLESIQKLSWEANLFIMPAGNPPPDPTRLLASEEMMTMMQILEQHFDLVIYATPPLMGLADVKLVAANAQSTILVTRLGRRGSADALAYTMTRLRSAGLPIAGIVANGVARYTVDLYA
jgi:polysaccharide biosynthesis transport protein